MSKRTSTTEDRAAKGLQRVAESREQKGKRIRERKDAYEKNKSSRTGILDARERRRVSADLQTLRAQTRLANAANVSASIQRRQSEKFGILVNLFAQSDKLKTKEPLTPFTPPIPTEALEFDAALAQPPTEHDLDMAKSPSVVRNDSVEAEGTPGDALKSPPPPANHTNSESPSNSD